MIDEKLDRYITEHISKEPERLTRLYRDTWLHRLYPRMCSDHYQGRVLKMLVEMIRPLRILELGAYTGYSTLCLAEGMPAGATIDSIEIDDEMTDELLALFADDPRGADIRLHTGDALKVVPTLPGYWDLVYIDANKRQYPDYLEMLLPRILPGGYIIADNTLWSGKVTEADDNDPQLRGIKEFNRSVKDNERLECIMLPIRDGISLIRKNP